MSVLMMTYGVHEVIDHLVRPPAFIASGERQDLLGKRVDVVGGWRKPATGHTGFERADAIHQVLERDGAGQGSRG
jgi:hypothetical protein